MLQLNYYSHLLLNSKYLVLIKLCIIFSIYLSFYGYTFLYCMTNGDDVQVSLRNDSNNLLREKIDTYMSISKQIQQIRQLEKELFDRETILRDEINALTPKIVLDETLLPQIQYESQKLSNKMQRISYNLNRLSTDYTSSNQELSNQFQNRIGIDLAPCSKSFRTLETPFSVTSSYSVLHEVENSIESQTSYTNEKMRPLIQNISLHNNLEQRLNSSQKVFSSETLKQVSLISDVPKPFLIKSKSDTNLFFLGTAAETKSNTANLVAKTQELQNQTEILQNHLNSATSGYDKGTEFIKNHFNSIEMQTKNSINSLNARADNLQRQNVEMLRQVALITQQVKIFLEQHK